MTSAGSGGEYRIDDLARHSGATVRTIRAYQDRGLLPRPGRRGRANVYDDSHLTRLRQISALLERGYTLSSIKELLAAWDEGSGLSGVLSLVSEVERPWSDEEPERVTLDDLDGLFGGGSARSEGAVAGAADGTVHEAVAGAADRAVHEAVAGAAEEAVELGVLVPLPERPGEFLVPSPHELAVAAELHRAGVPLLALTGHLRELRAQVEHIAAGFMDFTAQHIFRGCPPSGPTDEEASEAAVLVRRLRPLAKQTVDAELSRAMRAFASRSLREHLRSAAYETAGQGGSGQPPGGLAAGGPELRPAAQLAAGPVHAPAPERTTGSAGSAEGAAGAARPLEAAGPAKAPEAETAAKTADVTEAAEATGAARTAGAMRSAEAAEAAEATGAARTAGAMRSAEAAGPATPEAEEAAETAEAAEATGAARTARAAGAARSAETAEATQAMGAAGAGGRGADTESVPLPVGTLAAVRALVGDGNAAAFIASAAEREVQARAMDRLAAGS